MSVARRGAWVVAALATGLLLLLAFAWPGAGVPWSAGETREFELGRFQTAGATLAQREASVRAEGADPNGVTLLRQATPGLQAEALRFLHWRTDAPVPAVKHLLVWRSSVGQGTAPLPGATGTLDLARQPAWQGAIEWVGIAAAPVDYLPPEALPQAILELHQLRLSSASWRGAVAALWTEWSSPRPWSGRSSNTAGFELAPLAGPSLTAFIACWIALAVALAAWLLGRPGARSVALPLVIAGAALLAAAQVHQLTARARDARAAAAQVRETPATPLAAQPRLAATARRAADALSAQQPRARLLVHGANQFLGEYAVWLLRRHDAAMLWDGSMLPPPDAAGDWRLVLVGEGNWSFDAERRRLRIGTVERAAWPEWQEGPISIYRLLPEPSP